MFYQDSDFRNSLNNINLYLKHQRLNKVLCTGRFFCFQLSTVLLSVLHLNLQAENDHMYTKQKAK